MKLLQKSWLLLIAMGLSIGLAVLPERALSADLKVDAKTIVIEVDDDTLNEGDTFSTTGAEGDPDTLTDNLNFHGSDLQEFTSNSSSSLYTVDAFSYQVIMIRMFFAVWLF